MGSQVSRASSTDRLALEKLILGYVVRGEKRWILPRLTSEMFTGIHQEIYQAVLDGLDHGHIAENFGFSTIGDLMCFGVDNDIVLTPHMVDWFEAEYGRDVLRESLSKATKEVVEKSAQEVVGDIEETIKKKVVQRRKDNWIEYEQMEKKLKDSEDGVIGLRTGYDALDKQTSGLVSGQTWVVGGYSGYGKSFFAQNVMNNLLEQSPARRVFVASTEMSATAYIRRLVGIRCGIDARQVMGKLPKEEGEARDFAREELRAAIEEGNFIIDDQCRVVSDIVTAVKNAHQQREVDLVIVDFVQQLQGGVSDRKYDVLEKAVNRLQALAIELNVIVMVLSQISNEAMRSKDSPLYGYKGAGEIAEVADIGILIGRDVDAKKRFSRWFGVIIQKSRYGETGTVNLEIQFPGGKLINGKDRETY